MARVVIYGAGVVARMAHHYFATDSEHEVVAFTVDGALRQADEHRGLPLLDFENVVERHPPGDFAMFVAMGYAQMNVVRARCYDRARAAGYALVSYVSSRCTWLAEGGPGDNCLVMEDNTVQPFARIGSDVILWSGNHIGHDAVIGDHVFVTSHVVVSGFVQVGHHSFLGVNASLRDGIVVAPRTLVGAGAVITADTVEGGVYVPPRATLLPKTSDQVRL